MPTVPQDDGVEKWAARRQSAKESAPPELQDPNDSQAGKFFDRMHRNNAARLNLSRSDAEQIPLDAAAKIAKISATFGLSPEIIGQDKQTLSEYWQASQWLGGKPAREWALESPGLVRWVGSSKYYAALVKNPEDLKNLGIAERLARTDRLLWPKPDAALQEEAKTEHEATFGQFLRDRESSQQSNPVGALQGAYEALVGAPSDEALAKEHYESILARKRRNDAFFSGEGPIGAVESLNREFREDPWKAVPFASGLSKLEKASSLWAATQRTNAGVPTPQDEILLEDYGKMSHALARRGTSIGADIANGIVELVPFGVEFGLTSGIYTGVKEGILRGGMKLTAEAVEKSITKAVQSTLARRIGAFAAGSLAQTAAASPAKIAARYLENITPDVQISQKQRGELEAVLGDPKDKFKAAWEAVVGEVIEVASERSGVAIEKVITPIKMAVISKWMAKNPGAGIDDVLSKLKSASGWNGMLGEIFEERVGAAARAVAGIGDFKDIIPTWKQFATEAATLGVPSVAFGGLHLASRIGAKENAEATKNQFERISKALQGNPAVENAPAKVAEILDQASGNRMLSHNIDLWDAFWQKQTNEDGSAINPRDKAAELLQDGGKAYDAARVTGDDLQIPYGKAAVGLLANEEYGKFFQESLRLDSMEESRKEIDEELKAIEKEEADNEEKKSKESQGPALVAQAQSIVGGAELTQRANSISQRENITIEKATEIAAASVVKESQVSARRARTEAREGVRARFRQAIRESIAGVNLKGVRNEAIDILGDRLLILSERAKIDPEKLIASLPSIQKTEEFSGIGQESGISDSQIINKAIESVGADVLKSNAEKIAKKYKVDPQEATRRAANAVVKKNHGKLLQDKGEIHRGFFDRGRNLIGLLPGMDRSTLFHEFEHFYVDMIESLVASGALPKEFQDDLEVLWKAAGGTIGKKLTEAQHERLAKMFEKYLMRGEAPSERLRGAFRRMRTFLTDIYRQFKSYFDGINLTPEVREVMDRLLATEDEIAVMEANQGITPIFELAKGAGLTDAQAERIAKARIADRSASDAEFLDKRMADIRKRETLEWKKEAAEIRERIAPKVEGEPRYVALDILTRKETQDEPSIRIAKESIEAQFGKEAEDVLKAMPSGSVVAKGGMEIDAVAELVGYRNGRELVSDLADIESKEARIERLVNEQMEEIHGLPMSQEEIEAEALGALHNQDRSASLRVQGEILQEQHKAAVKDVVGAMSKTLPSVASVREQARRMIAGKKIRDIDLRVIQATERRAAMRKVAAFRKGDLETTLREIRNEWLASERYMAAREILAAIKKQEKDWRDLYSRPEADIAKTRDLDLVNAAGVILSAFKVITLKKASRAEKHLQKLAKVEGDLYEGLKADIDAATDNAQDYRELTYHEFTDMRDTVNSLIDLSSDIQKITVNGKKMGIEDARQLLLDVYAKRIKPSELRQYNRDKTRWEKSYGALQSIGASMRRVESWADAFDGGDINGPAHQLIFLPIKEAADTYRAQRIIYYDKLQKALAPIVGKVPDGKVYSEALKWEFDGVGQILMAIMHSGSNSSLSKNLRSRGWGHEIQLPDGSYTIDRTKWDAFMKEMFDKKIVTKEHMDALQDIGNILEELKPQAQKTYKEIYHRFFNEVDAAPIVTPWGTYRGWYFPAKPDPEESHDAAMREGKSLLEGDDYRESIPTTAYGFARDRKEGYAKPLLLDLRLAGQHIDMVLRFIHIAPRVKDVTRLVLSDQNFHEALESMDPGVVDAMLVPFLFRAANQVVEKPGGKGAEWRYADKTARWIRTAGARSVMFMNVVNALMQETGHSLAATKVSPKHLAAAQVAWFQGPKKLSDAIAEKSVQMKNGNIGQMIEAADTMADIMLNPTLYKEGSRWLDKNAYVLQNIFQNHVNHVAWWGAYSQAIEEGKDEKTAVREADSVVRLTQGSNSPEDISRVESGSPMWRLLMTFSGYPNMVANLQVSESQKAIRDLGMRDGSGRLFMVFLYTLALPAAMTVAIRAMAGDAPDDEDKNGLLDEYLYRYTGELWQNLAGEMTPPVGAVAKKLISYGQRYENRVFDSPGIQLVEKATGGTAATWAIIGALFSKEKVKKEDIREAMSLISILSKVPVGQATRSTLYLHDVESGKQKPQGAGDVIQGLLSGK